MSAEQLFDLMESAVNGELTEEQMGRLQETLDRDPAARTAYARYMSLDADLWLGTEKAPAAVVPPRSPSRSSWTGAFPLGFAAAAILFSVILVLRENSDFNPETAAAGDSIAFLARTVDAESIPADVEASGVFSAGRAVRLESGMMEILFSGGTRVLLQGQARFVPEWTNRGEVVEGTVTVYVPPGELGFTLDVPGGTVTSPGGEFGIAVSAGGTDVTLLAGEVDVRRYLPGDSSDAQAQLNYRVLSGGQTVRITKSGLSAGSTVPFETFSALADRTRTTVIREDFAGAELSPDRWQTLLRAPKSRITLHEGRAEIVNRGWLATSRPYDPVRLGGIRLRGRWRFSGPVEGERSARVNIFNVVLRGGLEEGPRFHEVGSGIKFTCFTDNGHLFFVTEGDRLQVSRARRRGFLRPKGAESFDFDIVDDGVNLTFTVREADNPGNYTVARATVLRDSSPDNFILVYSREFHAPDRTYAVQLENVVLETGIGP